MHLEHQPGTNGCNRGLHPHSLMDVHPFLIELAMLYLADTQDLSCL